MPFLPTPSDVQVEDTVLTDFGIAYLQDPNTRFFSLRAAPPTPVDKESGKYPVWDGGDLNRDTFAQRSPGESTPKSTIRLSNDNYKCFVHKDALIAPDEVIANEAASVDVMEAHAKALANKFMIRMDRDFVSNYLVTSTWTGSSTGADKTTTNWSDTASGTPRKDLDVEIEAIDANGGPADEQVLFLEPTDFNNLKRHPDFADIYTGNAQPNPNLLPSMLAAVLGIRDIVVCRSNYTTSAEGAATTTYGRIWTTAKGLLLHVPSESNLYTQTAIKTFFHSELSGRPDNNAGLVMREYYDEDRDSWIVKGLCSWDRKVVNAKLGAYLTGLAG